MSNGIPHLYGEITWIEVRTHSFFVKIDARNNLTLPRAAEDQVAKMRKGARILLDLAAWENHGVGHVSIFDRAQGGNTFDWRHVISFTIGSDVCHLDLFDPRVLNVSVSKGDLPKNTERKK